MILPDERLPGFTRCFDMGFMRHAVEESLPALGPVRACRLERFRYRRNARASFLYQIETGDGRTWISGSLFKGSKSRGIFEAAAGHPAMGYVPDIGMVLERFPHDRKLTLAAALAAGECGGMLSALAPHFGGAAPAITEVVPIRYRPRIAAVFRIAAGSAATGRRFYVKIYADEDVRAAADMLAHCRNGARFAIVRPVAVLPESNAIIWPEIAGSPLTQALQSSGAPTGIRQCAAALAEFHASRQALPAVSPAGYARTDAQKHAAFVSSLLPALAEQVQACAHAIPLPFTDAPAGPFHHDMKPEHALLDGGFTTLIDVEGLAQGDPAFDIGNMLARISAGGWLQGVPANRAKRALSEFRAHSVPVSRTRLASAFALGKLKLATYAISHQIDGWAAIAAAEIASACSALDAHDLA